MAVKPLLYHGRHPGAMRFSKLGGFSLGRIRVTCTMKANIGMVFVNGDDSEGKIQRC